MLINRQSGFAPLIIQIGKIVISNKKDPKLIIVFLSDELFESIIESSEVGNFMIK